MTTANIKITKVLLGRGNTAISANYTGVMGEVTMDTTLKTLRVHDGVAVGGTRLATYSELANVSVSNVDLSGYTTTSAFNAFTTYANATFSTIANAGSQQTQIDSVRANVTAANSAISALQANAAVQASLIDTLTGNAATQGGVLNDLVANAAAQSSELTSLLSNAAVQANELTILIGNASTQTTQIDLINANIANVAPSLTNGAYQLKLQANGNVTVPGGVHFIVPENGNIALRSTGATGNAHVEWHDDATGDRSTVRFSATGVEVYTTSSGVQRSWLFHPDGSTHFPQYTFPLGAGAPDSYLKSDGAGGLNWYAEFGNVIPSANVTYSLGSETRQWKDLWVSNNTIYIGNTPIRVDGGTLLVDGAPVSLGFDQDLNTTDNVAFANIVTTGGQITVPTDTSFALRLNHSTFGEANVIVDSQGYMSITGGYTGTFFTQTLSDGEQIGSFGYSGNISDIYGKNGLTISTVDEGGPRWTFDTNGDLSVPNYISFEGNTYIGDEPGGGNPMFRIVTPLGYGATIETDSDLSGNSWTWTFGVDGTLGSPGDITAVNFIGDGSQLTGLPDGTAITNGTSTIDIPVAGGNIYVGVDDVGSTEFTINGINTLNLVSLGNVSATKFTYANGVNILDGISGNITGNIISGSSEIQFVANSSGDGYGLDTMRLIPYNLGYDSAHIVLDPTYPNHIHIRAGGAIDNSPAELFLGGENSYFRVDSGANPNVSIRANDNDWYFGTDGNLTIGTVSPHGGIYRGIVWDWGLGQPALGLAEGEGSNSYIRQTENGLEIHPNEPGDMGDGDLRIRTGNVSPGGTSYDWIFNGSGGLTFPTGGNVVFDSSAVSVIDGVSSVVFADATTQTTAWTGTVDFGNTIAIGYNTGTVSQGGGAVAVGSTAGNVSQGTGAVAIGEAAGRSSQGTEGIAVGKTAGEQSQGAYSIAIGSATAYYQQGTGAVAIGTSAGALQQGNSAIAIGTGAGNALQGDNSIILNATGTTLDQTTANTFTVAPIRNVSSTDGVLQYNASTKEVSYNVNTTLGVLKIEDGVHEKFQTKSNATGTVTHDCSSGHIFYHTLPSANWTANFTNLNLSSGYATSLTLVIEQGATGYYPSAVEIGGSAVPLAWQGNTTPTPSSNRFDVVTFSILNDGLYTVLGQLTGF